MNKKTKSKTCQCYDMYRLISCLWIQLWKTSVTLNEVSVTNLHCCQLTQNPGIIFRACIKYLKFIIDLEHLYRINKHMHYIQNTRGQYKFLGLVGENKSVMLVWILQTLPSYLQLQYLEVEFHAAGSSEANNCLAPKKMPTFYGILMFSTVFHIYIIISLLQS